MNWHDIKELPIKNRICVIKEFTGTKIDYNLAKFDGKKWRYKSNKLVIKPLAWGYINEPDEKL